MKVAEEFQVSVTAAALHLLAFTYDRVAVIACRTARLRGRRVRGTSAGGSARASRSTNGASAYDFFKKGKVSEMPETVSAEAWVPNARAGTEVIEHVFPMSRIGVTLSLLWFPAT